MSQCWSSTYVIIMSFVSPRVICDILNFFGNIPPFWSYIASGGSQVPKGAPGWVPASNPQPRAALLVGRSRAPCFCWVMGPPPPPHTHTPSGQGAPGALGSDLGPPAAPLESSGPNQEVARGWMGLRCPNSPRPRGSRGFQGVPGCLGRWPEVLDWS